MKDIEELLRHNEPTHGKQLGSAFTSGVVEKIETRLNRPTLIQSFQELYTKFKTLPKAALAVFAVVVIGSLGAGAYFFNQQNSHMVGSSEVGKDATEGLRAAGGDPESSDLKILDTDELLGVPAPSAVAEEDDIKVSIDVIDSNGFSWKRLAEIQSDFQLNTKDGKPYEPIDIVLATEGVAVSSCKLTQKFIADELNAPARNTILATVAKQHIDVYDGVHALQASCSAKGKTVTAGLNFRVADSMAKKCKSFSFNESAITTTSYESLKAGVVGKWEGCVKTSWMPAYYVYMTLNSDGTYSAHSDELLDGAETNAMYYGSEVDSPDKRYSINDFQANKTGLGDIDIANYGEGVVPGGLKNIRLMGDKLSFDFYNMNQGSPLTFQFYRK